MPSQAPLQSRRHLELTVAWDGPFTPEYVVANFRRAGSPPDYDGDDYGVYQIYGTHTLTGPDTLLYIGQATQQTFATRFRQHAQWLADEDPTLVFLGRIYKPGRHTARRQWATWTADVVLVERILIYKYSPAFNGSAISLRPNLGVFRSVDLVHQGQRHKLHPRDSAPRDWG